jgi:Tol biopolymer transport system component
MTVTAPPHPPRPSDPIDGEELEALVEALIEEARQRQRRRRRIYMVVAAAAALVSVVVFTIFERTAQSQTASPSFAGGPNALAVTATPKIAFMAFTKDVPPWDTALYVVNADGSGRRILTRTAWNIEAPAWSPDGRKLAFERRVSPLVNGQCACDIDLFVMNADGSGQQSLTRHPVYDRHPVWSPDGQKLAFVRYRDVWVMNADGSDQRRVTPNRQGDRDPVWSPGGQQMAFTSFRGFNWDVWVMNADGTGHRNLTRNRAQDYSPTWSPDGSKIAFVRTRNSSRLHGHPWEIWVMNADGSGQQLLARKASHPAWSPAGRRIVFQSNHDGNQEI